MKKGIQVEYEIIFGALSQSSLTQNCGEDWDRAWGGIDLQRFPYSSGSSNL